MWDFVMDKSGAGAGFLRELRFSLPICFSTIIFTITRGWHNRPGVAAVPIASQTRIKKEVSKPRITRHLSNEVINRHKDVPPKEE
jgi:hypothetical protein